MNSTKYKILVVEDDEIYQDTIAEILRGRGWIVGTANSGKKAQEILQTEKFHLVLSDVQMPNGNGLELLKYLRDQHPEIPAVVMMTGFSALNSTDLKASGAFSVLEKPFTSDLLQRALKVALESIQDWI